MAKNKTSFIVTLSTEETIKATYLAAMVRSTLTGQKIGQGASSNHKGENVGER